MKKIALLLAFVTLALTQVFAQVEISGVVIDKTSDQPFGYVSVALLQGDKVVKGAMSDEAGEFLIEGVANGTYTLRVSFMGYADATKTFNITGKNKKVKLGNIEMYEDTKMLNEVEVVAQGSQGRFEIDKKVFSVDQSIAAAGGDATEVLQGIPSVEVDNDGGVSLRNNSNVEIWINGKPSGLTDENRGQVLEQMPAENIESVEIITNPSAKYSPEGSAGVINIVLKKDIKPGYYGSVNAGLSHAVRSDKVGERLGGSVTFNAGKWDGTANIGFRNDYKGSETDVDRYYNASDGTLSSVMYQDTWQRTRRTGINGNLALNYRINDAHTIGVSGRVGWRDQGYDSKMKYTKEDAVADTVQRQYSRIVDGSRNPLNVNAQIDHGWNFDKFGSSLQTSFLYSHFGDDKNYNYLQQGYNDLDQNQITNNDNTTYEFKSDLTKKIKTHIIEAGVNVKYQDRKSNSSVEDYNGSSYVQNALLVNDYRYKEQLYAAYLSYGSRIKNFGYQLGIRGEYVIVDNSSNGIANPQKSYFQPFPTVFLSYALPRNNEIQLNYTRRINRPRGGKLNSYHDVSDSTNVSFGNPDLDPEYVTALELNYIKSWEKHTFSASLYYHFTEDVIRSFQFMDVDSVLNTTYMNTTKESQAGAEFVLKNTIAKWFNLTTTLNLFYEKIDASDFSLPASLLGGVTPIDSRIHIAGDEDFSWSAKAMGNFMFTKTFTGQLTAAYRSARLVTQGEQKGFFTLDLGLRKTFWNKKLSLAFTARDILNSRKTEKTTTSEHFKQYYKSVPFGPNFRLTATYNFGNGKKNKKGRDQGQDRDDREDETGIDPVDEY